MSADLVGVSRLSVGGLRVVKTRVVWALRTEQFRCRHVGVDFWHVSVCSFEASEGSIQSEECLPIQLGVQFGADDWDGSRWVGRVSTVGELHLLVVVHHLALLLGRCRPHLLVPAVRQLPHLSLSLPHLLQVCNY